jgi:lysophospholipase L1-like esterase
MPTRPTVSPRLANTRFMAFGDSITTGEVTVPVSRADQDERSAPTVIVPSAAYPSVLADLLRSSYPQQAGAIEVFNEGRGAEAVTNALPRFRDAFDARRPEVVLLMEGYNDICCGGRSAGENAAAAVAAIADEARHRGARVFIANLAPSKPGFRAGSAEALDGFNAVIPSITSSGHYVLVDVFSQLEPELDRNIGIDGLHPTEVGYRRIAQAFYFAIKSTLEMGR